MKNKKWLKTLALISLIGGFVLTQPFVTAFSDNDGRPPVVFKTH